MVKNKTGDDKLTHTRNSDYSGQIRLPSPLLNAQFLLSNIFENSPAISSRKIKELQSKFSSLNPLELKIVGYGNQSYKAKDTSKKDVKTSKMLQKYCLRIFQFSNAVRNKYKKALKTFLITTHP